jgi:hypothetical protein
MQSGGSHAYNPSFVCDSEGEEAGTTYGGLFLGAIVTAWRVCRWGRRDRGFAVDLGNRTERTPPGKGILDGVLSREWHVAFVYRCLTLCVVVMYARGPQTLFKMVKTTPRVGDTSRDEVRRCSFAMLHGCVDSSLNGQGSIQRSHVLIWPAQT